ncbi:MAG: response regulator [Verrucomicrobiota bacterium]
MNSQIPEAKYAQSKMKPGVLVIDDDPHVRMGLAQVLGKEYTVSLVGSIGEGLERLRHQRLDAILLDLCLNEESGIDGLKQIREVNTSIPILIITGYPSFSTAVDAVRFGANDYIEKPIKSSTLRDRLKDALEKSVQGRDKPLVREQMIKTRPIRIDRERNETVLEMIHDLSNPLTTLGFLVEDLYRPISVRDKGLNEDESERIQEVTRRLGIQIDYITSLLSHWRDMEKMHTYTGEHVSMQRLLLEIKEQRLPIDQHKHIDITWLMPAKDSVQVIGHATQLKRAIMNLLDNAIEATSGKKGKVIVRLGLVKDRCVLVVTDNGYGVAKENLRHIFRNAWTTKPTGEGHGLGLALAERTIKQHRGHIFFASVKCSGSVFTINLPLATR